MQSKISTQLLTRMALLIALTIIAERLLSIRVNIGGIEGIRLGVGSLPIVFAGVFMGPLAGGLVGGIADLVGYFINPMGPYMPHFSITSALRGIIPGLVIYIASRGKREIGVFPLLLAVSAMFVVVNILILPYFHEILFGLLRVVTVPAKIVEAAICIPVYSAILVTLGRATQKAFAPLPGQVMLRLSGKLW